MFQGSAFLGALGSWALGVVRSRSEDWDGSSKECQQERDILILCMEMKDNTDMEELITQDKRTSLDLF